MPRQKEIIDYVSWKGAVGNSLKWIEVIQEHVLTWLASLYRVYRVQRPFFFSLGVLLKTNLHLKIIMNASKVS